MTSGTLKFRDFHGYPLGGDPKHAPGSWQFHCCLLSGSLSKERTRNRGRSLTKWPVDLPIRVG